MQAAICHQDAIRRDAFPVGDPLAQLRDSRMRAVFQRGRSGRPDRPAGRGDLRVVGERQCLGGGRTADQPNQVGTEPTGRHGVRGRSGQSCDPGQRAGSTSSVRTTADAVMGAPEDESGEQQGARTTTRERQNRVQVMASEDGADERPAQSGGYHKAVPDRDQLQFGPVAGSGRQGRCSARTTERAGHALQVDMSPTDARSRPQGGDGCGPVDRCAGPHREPSSDR